MQLIGEYMNRHHRHCDDILARAGKSAAAGDWAGLERDFGTFLREIERHIEAEETLLFPAFEEKTGMAGGPAAVMRAEHREMREIFARMRAASEGKDGTLYLGVSGNLLSLLEQHNMKKERMLYPMIDASMGDGAHELLTKVESVMT